MKRLITICAVVTMILTASVVASATNYDRFGTIMYVWGNDQGAWANNMKWFFMGGGVDQDQWNGRPVTVANSLWSDWDGQAYLQYSTTANRAEWFALWRDYDGSNFSNQVTTVSTGNIGNDPTAAYLIDGHVAFNPVTDSVGDPRETVTGISHMYAAGYNAQSTLQVSLPVGGDHYKYEGQQLELVESAWTDLNGLWYMKVHHGQGASAWYEMYANYDGVTYSGIAATAQAAAYTGDPYRGTEGYLSAVAGRLVPEPATVCLLGLGSLSLIRRKRRA